MKNKDGEYVDVPYRSDAILVILGAKIPHWTNDKYKATVRGSKCYLITTDLNILYNNNCIVAQSVAAR